MHIGNSFYLVDHHPLGVREGGDECLGQGQPGKRRKAWR